MNQEKYFCNVKSLKLKKIHNIYSNTTHLNVILCTKEMRETSTKKTILYDTHSRNQYNIYTQAFSSKSLLMKTPKQPLSTTAKRQQLTKTLPGLKGASVMGKIVRNQKKK